MIAHASLAVPDAGPLQSLLDTPGTTDVLVNGGLVWTDDGGGLRRRSVDLGDEEQIRALAVRLAAAAGRRLDTAAPFVDARLSDTVRLHAVIPPIARDGTCLSLRVLRRWDTPLADLVGSPQLAGVLRALVGARVSFVVTGGTGAGKTTLLGALLEAVDPGERLVIVEDASELAPALPHVVRLESRLPNVEAAGRVELRDLVRQALRMRPDRLVVGEVRGAEVADLLLALNTGHDGGATTVHANGVAELPARLSALGALAGIGRRATAEQVAAGLQVCIHCTRDGPRRRVAAIGVLTAPSGKLTAQPAVVATGTGWRAGPAAPALHALLAGRGQPPW